MQNLYEFRSSEQIKKVYSHLRTVSIQTWYYLEINYWGAVFEVFGLFKVEKASEKNEPPR